MAPMSFWRHKVEQVTPITSHLKVRDPTRIKTSSVDVNIRAHAGQALLVVDCDYRSMVR
ncbi:hypothetical protein EMIT0P294_80230 [Pseudomonas sp. IT-P294]